MDPEIQTAVEATKPESKFEALVREKMKAGLDRKQAENLVRAQFEHDKKVAADDADSKKKTAKA